MSVDKVIIKAVLSTLAAIGALLVLMISTLCIAFPSTMMGLTYRLGMESASIHFAERAYKNSEDVYFLSYATEVAIEEGKTEKILSLGEKFIAHDGFDVFCAKKGAQEDAYRQFIYGRISVAKYDLGDGKSAVDFAYESLNGEFKSNNPLVAVMIAAMGKEDKVIAQTVLDKLNLLSVSGEEQAYLSEAKAAISEFLNG